MGRWKDADGYWVDEDEDLYAEAKSKHRRGCACFPKGDAPGYCPGQDSCPLIAEDDPEPELEPDE